MSGAPQTFLMAMPGADDAAPLSVGRRASLAAALALRGFELKQTDKGTYIVVRWGLSRELNSLDAVAGFAKHVGVQHG